MKISLSSINGTPIFTVEDPTATGSRVFGGTLDRAKTHWRFPAFPPFIEKVLHDFDKVYRPLTPGGRSWEAPPQLQVHPAVGDGNRENKAHY